MAISKRQAKKRKYTKAQKTPKKRTPRKSRELDVLTVDHPAQRRWRGWRVRGPASEVKTYKLDE